MYCVTSLLCYHPHCTLHSLRKEGGARYRSVSGAVLDNKQQSRVNWITGTLQQTNERSEALHKVENYLVTSSSKCMSLVNDCLT